MSKLFILFFTLNLVFTLNTYSQAQGGNSLDTLKNSIADFNAKRAYLNSNVSEDFIIEKLNTDSDLGVILNYLDKLDQKIVRLVFFPNQKKLKIFYSAQTTIVDIMQGLKGINYPAYFVSANGDHASINEYGNIEFINMNK